MTYLGLTSSRDPRQCRSHPRIAQRPDRKRRIEDCPARGHYFSHYFSVPHPRVAEGDRDRSG